MGIASYIYKPSPSLADRQCCGFGGLLSLPLYQIGGLVLFRGDRRCYGGGLGMGILRGGFMVVCGGAGLLGL